MLQKTMKTNAVYLNEKMLVGVVEFCKLAELEIEHLPIRIDTGAATSSLHVDNIKEFRRDGLRWVSFDLDPNVHDVDHVVSREAKIVATRNIKSSNASSEKRIVIETTIELGDQRWVIQLTLTDRSGMSYLMLLGREAMSNKVIVDPEHEYLLGDLKGNSKLY